jgi:hypothetical protein
MTGSISTIKTIHMKKHSLWLLCLPAFVIAGSFIQPGSKVVAEKKESKPLFVAHVYNAVDNNSVVVGKVLLHDNAGTLTAGLYDGSGPTCIDYTNETVTGGSIGQLRGGCVAYNVTITYNYPASMGGGAGSITINGAIDCGGIICD